MAQYARPGHDNNFHLIRHLAAICVVLTHSFSVPTAQFESEPLVSLTGASLGHYAVDVFFLLSGFLVTQSILRDNNLLRFTLARLLRIFPGLLAAVFLVALLLGPIVSDVPPQAYFFDPSTWNYLIGAGSTLFVDGTLPGVFSDLPEAGNINVPLWTLKYELAAYALLGIMAGISLLRARWLIAAALAFVVLGYIAGRSFYPWPESEGMLSNLLHLVPAFFIGAVAYLLREKIPYGIALTAFLAALAFIVHDTPAYEIAEKLFFASIVLWLAFLPSGYSQWLERRGDFSYGIYIYHYPVLQTLVLYFPEIGTPYLFAVGLALTLFMASISWHWVEKPSLQMRKTIQGKFEIGRLANGPNRFFQTRSRS